jgi:hypothetical protein
MQKMGGREGKGLQLVPEVPFNQVGLYLRSQQNCSFKTGETGLQ